LKYQENLYAYNQEYVLKMLWKNALLYSRKEIPSYNQYILAFFLLIILEK